MPQNKHDKQKPSYTGSQFDDIFNNSDTDEDIKKIELPRKSTPFFSRKAKSIPSPFEVNLESSVNSIKRESLEDYKEEFEEIEIEETPPKIPTDQELHKLVD